MTPEERILTTNAFLGYLERATLAKEDGDLYTARVCRAEADRLRLLLLREEMFPERGPQGDAAC